MCMYILMFFHDDVAANQFYQTKLGQIQNLCFCNGRNLGDIFICPEFPVVRLDTMNGFSEWMANVLS